MGKVAIKTNKLNKVYSSEFQNTIALKEINLEIEEGEFVSIMGPSGAGKTTFLNIIGFLDKHSSGNLSVFGHNPIEFNEEELSRIRGERVGFVFEDFLLIPSLNALENVQLPLIFAKNDKGNEIPKILLKKVGLGHRLTHYPNELSGGELQRVAVARALSNNPKILLADEPTGNLDTRNARELFILFRNLNKEEGITIVVATHNVKLGHSADRIIHLNDGKIERDERLVKQDAK